jgi:hypothetical protein
LPDSNITASEKELERNLPDGKDGGSPYFVYYNEFKN